MNINKLNHSFIKASLFVSSSPSTDSSNFLILLLAQLFLHLTNVLGQHPRHIPGIPFANSHDKTRNATKQDEPT